MKSRLIVLALAMLYYGHMQAAEGAKSWFANQLNRLRNYTPYQQGSFKTYPLENVASRLASMRHLYGSDVAQNQEQLIDDYQKYLDHEYIRQRNKQDYHINAMFGFLDRCINRGYDSGKLTMHTADETYTTPSYNEYYNFAEKQARTAGKKSSRIESWKQNLRPTISQQEAEMLKPRTFYQYQHPDQYILNN